MIYMFQRVKQVLSALTAKITTADRQFVKANLSEAEAALFWAMNLPDQRHALNVCYTALKLLKQYQHGNRITVIKSALLHDVGKVRGDVSTIDKIITVMAHKLAPHWACAWGRPGRGSKITNLRHAFYTYFHHPEKSYSLLEAIGVDPVITDIVRRHHEAPARKDSPELTILREADNAN